MRPTGLTPALALACMADIDAMLAVRRAAVHARAAACYGPGQIDSWLAHPMEGLAAAVACHGEPVIVARQAACVLGFAWASTGPRAHLRSLYVAPAAMGCGIGSALLKAVEDGVRDLGAPVLWLAATLNATEFYRQRGYLALGSFTWQPPAQPPAAALPLCRMRKAITPR